MTKTALRHTVPSRARKVTRARRHQAARKSADRHLHRLPNVVGSCFGIKHTAGVSTGQLSYTLLVSQKVSEHGLAPAQRIPATVTRLGRRMPTDVRVIGTLRRESGFAIDDGTQLGTIGAFARRADGSLYALTCAHCIPGGDGNIHTPANLRVEFPTRFGAIVPLGISADAEISDGTGLQPEFGEFDAAIAELTGAPEITAPALLDHVRNCTDLPVYEPPSGLTPEQMADLLNFTTVQGWGAASNTVLVGQIIGVMVTFEGHFFDLMISAPDGQGLTIVGDSGLVWTGPLGKAYGIHMAGDGPIGSPSPNTFACFAHRATTRFDVTLLTP